MHPKMAKEMNKGAELAPAQRAKLDMLKELQRIANELIAQSSSEDDMASEKPEGMAVMIAQKKELSPEEADDEMEMASAMEDSEDEQEDALEMKSKLAELLKKKQSV